MTARALVVGGSGFIGRHLLRTLAAQGNYHRIDSIDLVEPEERVPSVAYHRLDATRTLPETLADETTTIYNLAAHRTFPGFADAEYFRTNVGSTERVLELAERTRVRRIVFTSTMSVYRPGDDAKTETSQIDPVNAYGASKVEAERLHDLWLDAEHDRQLVICRPAVIFGFRDNGNFTRLSRALEKGYFVFVGRRDTIKSCGYVCDLIDSFDFAIQRQERKIIYNFSYPERYTIEEIVEAFCSVANYRRPRLVLPRGLLQLAALPFELGNAIGLKNPIHRKRLTKLNEATNIIPKWLMDQGFVFKTDLRSALESWYRDSGSREFL
jgi:Nucleoside-diphosphate-sugar epimerases